jgi:hypothetical protein
MTDLNDLYLVDDMFGPPLFDTPDGFVAAWLLRLAEVIEEGEMGSTWDDFCLSTLQDLPPGWEPHVFHILIGVARFMTEMAKRVKGMESQ